MLLERKSKATLMRDRAKVKADVTRESKSVKDYWIDCRQLEAFELMAWVKVKKELSRWLVLQAGVHVSTDNHNRTVVARKGVKKVKKADVRAVVWHWLRHCSAHNVVRIRSAGGVSGSFHLDVIGGDMKRNIENVIAAREAQEENLRIEADRQGKAVADVREEWSKLVKTNDTLMRWGYKKERELLKTVPDKVPAVELYRNLEEPGRQKREEDQTNAPETPKTPDGSQQRKSTTPVVESDNAEPEREKSAAKGTTS